LGRGRRAYLVPAARGAGRGHGRRGAGGRHPGRVRDPVRAEAATPTGRRPVHGGRPHHPAAMTSPEPGPASTRAFLGLGSNLGARWMHLRKAVDQLRGGSGIPVTAVSPVYETEPVGGPEDQGPYLNVVVELALPPRFDAYRLLTECHRLEASAGRVRS